MGGKQTGINLPWFLN